MSVSFILYITGPYPMAMVPGAVVDHANPRSEWKV